jgi:hypothetical protein
LNLANYTTGHQTSLFSVADVSAGYRVAPIEPLQISVDELQSWKQRVFQHQQQVMVNAPAQGSLFTLPPTIADLTDCIDLFNLPRQNIEFWRWKADGEGVSALYFVVDDELPIVLYVGETVKSGLRWKGEHDCKRYILNYISAHRPHCLSVTVNISFWENAPTSTRDRQKLESALIHKWRSPFNKENWKYWNTPFVSEG